MDGDPYRTPGRPDAGPPNACPRCGAKLEATGTRWVCQTGKCGEWLPPRLVGGLLDIPEPGGEYADVLRRLAARAEGAPDADCPCCGTTMDTAMRACVVFDYCPVHGVWLDRGELAALQHARQIAEMFG